MNSNRSIAQQLFLLLAIGLCCSFLGTAIGRIITLTFYGKSAELGVVSNSLSLIELLITHAFTFLGTYLVFAKLNQINTKSFFVQGIQLKTLFVVLLLAFAGLYLSEFLAQSSLIFFEKIGWFHVVDAHIEQQETILKILTPEGSSKFMLSLFAMAIIPAIGEELIFRGLIQNIILASSSKKHFSVIVSALIFAALHFQPVNLLSIFFMGIVLGYIYEFTKNIFYAMLFHFLNNAALLLVLYYYPEMT